MFGALDADLEDPDDVRNFLPDNTTFEDLSSSTFNISKYFNPNVPQHLGALMLPTMGGALGIPYNVPGFQSIGGDGSFGPLILNATVLGGIFCGGVRWWNDTSIQDLNRGVVMPNEKIVVVVRGDMSGASKLFTQYLSSLSPQFNRTVGASYTPSWPSTFVIAHSATEVVYAITSRAFSISYVPMEQVVQASEINMKIDVAMVLNAYQIPKLPDLDSLQRVMQDVSDKPFTRQNYQTIFGVDDPEAYPISILSFILLREHYYYFAPGTQQDCDAVKALVYFWYFFYTDSELQGMQVGNGWVPTTGRLLEDNIRALELITCNRINVLSSLYNDLNRAIFYADKHDEYDWDYAIPFWENSTKFQTSPVGSTLYILFYSALILSNAIPFGYNMTKHLKEERVGAPVVKHNSTHPSAWNIEEGSSEDEQEKHDEDDENGKQEM
ncbi:UNVERIFIED_CONTAM: hypothetical protein HDU68_002977, partial [Siphonaria sp. JEL0065]